MNLPPAVMSLWFKPLKPVKWDSNLGELVLEAPEGKVPTIRSTYVPVIQKIASSLHGSPVKVTLQSGTNPDVNIIDPHAKSEEEREKEERRREETGLLPGLTFENYVNGNANQLAVAAAEHVASSVGGTQYNPLYIYGGVGLGKTHLMQAIGHRYLDLHPKAKVRCVSAQDFISEYTAATRDSVNSRKALQMFDERYKSLDLLLIDDVQSFSGAKGSQAQFFRAFEALVPHNKQVVLTADTYTRNLKDIEQRIISRLSQGLSVAIEPPELEMRIAILLNKAQAAGVDLPEEVAMFIAKRLKSNVRELEGALQQIIAFQQFQPEAAKEITIDIAKHVLRDQFSADNNLVTIENIQKTVADYYSIKVSEMYSKRRPASIARPRQIAMYLSKELTQHSLPEIGQSFGGRDHTTVMHAVRKITQERQANAELNHEIHVLEQMIRG
jgi:chromosomal replication initiator protein